MMKGKVNPKTLSSEAGHDKKLIFGKNQGREGNIYYNNYRDTTSDGQRWTALWYILLRWKGSVYKMIWHDLIIFGVAFGLLVAMYHCILVHYPIHKQRFELLCIYAHRFGSSIPITFLTGFYVSSVVSRWWDQFMSLPYPDQLALKLVAFIPGQVSICHWQPNKPVNLHII